MELTKLRSDAGLTQAQVAHAIGVSRALYGFYETGERPIPADVRQRLGVLLGAERGKAQATLGFDVLLRSNAADVSPTAQAELNVLDGVLELYVDLLRHFGLDSPVLTSSPFPAAVGRQDKATAERHARAARGWLHGQLGSLADPLDAISRFMLVFRLRLGDDISADPSGLFVRHPQAGLILVVNADYTLGRQHFSVAHELAHALHHSQQYTGLVSSVASLSGRGESMERFANQFAIEFLMPADDVARAVERLPKWVQNNPPSHRVVLVQDEFAASYQSTAYRLRNLGHLSKSELDEALKVGPASVRRTLGRDPSPLDQKQPPVDRLAGLPAVVQWLIADGIDNEAVTVGDVAETVGVSTEAVRRLIATPAAPDESFDDTYERHVYG